MGSVICEPICSQDCGHGRCIAPEICQCDPGYAKRWPMGTCDPHCPQKCVNSHCEGAGKCRCYEGFQLRQNSSTICDPVCSPSCQNATCVEPDTCACLPGYEDTKVKYQCVPACRPRCENGRCTAPGRCDCDAGHAVTNASEPHSCRPQCREQCINAECLAPEKCVCLPGYRLLSGSSSECEPICSKPCGSGRVCTGPEICEGVDADWDSGLESKFSESATHLAFHWSMFVLAILLCLSLVMAPLLVIREMQRRRRGGDKQRTNLIENPSYGVMMANEDATSEQGIGLGD